MNAVNNLSLPWDSLTQRVPLRGTHALTLHFRAGVLAFFGDLFAELTKQVRDWNVQAHRQHALHWDSSTKRCNVKVHGSRSSPDPSQQSQCSNKSPQTL